MSQLSIYKASAGSGKTFKLTEEYLILLFKYTDNYRRILAVTFTNKATAEMKSRILSELNKLAKGSVSDYRDTIKNTYQLTDSEVQSKAARLLSVLLHDFSKFSVSTIDKFFQKIIRSFTRELGIQPGYTIELNENEILSKVVDELLLDLDNNEELKKWLSGLASDSIEQGKKWEFKDHILQLAKEIFKEEYKNFDHKLIEKMSDKDFLKNYIKNLQKIKQDFEKFLTQKAEEALSLIHNHGLSIDDFSRKGSGPAGHFNKIIIKGEYEPGKLFVDATEDSTKWYTKTSDKKDSIEALLNSGLMDISKEILFYYEKNKIDYYTSAQILKYIHTLGILTDISGKLREYCRDQNIFLISDTAQLLQTVIGGNESPFIYEKTGSIYRHFMIDEFQDTSAIQWSNFKPLINNSLSQGSKNLVVGDIKQSIYRWRNSDWEILSEKITEDFKQFEPREKTLNTNWRSKKNIIDFNNTVFHYSAQILQSQFNSEYEENKNNENPYETKIASAYQDVFQKNPDKNKNEGGYISHIFLNDKEFDSWKEEVKNRIPSIVENLQEKGFQLRDIAILVRSGKEGQEIANTLIDYKNSGKSNYRFDFISNDSLYLGHSSLVKFILAIFEFILDQDDEINLSFIVHEYSRYLQDREIPSSEIHDILKKREKNSIDDKLFSKQLLESVLAIKQLPLYELTDRIVRIFNLNEIKTELPYLKSFLDIVLSFSKKATSDIHTFLTWWNEEGYTKTLSVSETQNAIRIITVHKSKGLEFKNVIIPFCSWEIDHKPLQTNFLWCHPTENPFNQLELIPVKYSRELQNTIFKNDYLLEKFHTYVDNLNLLYVAFTRAEENLFCFSPVKENSNSIKNVGELLHFVYQNYQEYPGYNGTLEFSDRWSSENSTFEFGEISNAREVSADENNKLEINKFESYDIQNKLRLKLHDNSFFTGQESASYQKVNHGKVMHEIFENIKTADDISRAIDRLIFAGKVSPEEKSIIVDKIESIFKNNQIKNWFSDEWNVKTEAEIILPSGKSARPDRVISNHEKIIVIDYKFGEHELDKHYKQVKNYIEAIGKMESKKVEGYLWYVDLGNIVPCS